MEFNCNLEEILPGRITVVESKDSQSILTVYDVNSWENSNNEISGSWICNLSSNIIWDPNIRKKKEHLECIIDLMGHASAKAQDLLAPITTFKKLLNSNQQKIYIIRDVEIPHYAIGILKIGLKRLFICDDIGAHHEVDATCVLDFYIHESKQRCGLGHELFDTMLRVEQIEPSKLAIDRPSFKFLAFLGKHYGLSDPKSQANNFVVYSDFFQNREISRPPIFLYNKKDLQMSNERGSKPNSPQENSNITESLNALHTVPVSTSKNAKKSFYSCPGNCYSKNDSNAGLYDHFRKKRSQNVRLINEVPTLGNKNADRNWGVYDALHTYSRNDNNFDDSRNNHNSQCSLTPVDNDNVCTQKNWDQLQSSWNVLGVKPVDYSINQKKS